MRLINKDGLLSVLNDHWLAMTPKDTDSEEVKAERNAMSRGMDLAFNIVRDFPDGWISVEDKLPEQHESIFARWYGTEKWSKAMWLMASDLVIVAIRFKDGTGTVRTGDLRDGVWYTSVARSLEPVVTHWMPFPEPPKGESTDAID